MSTIKKISFVFLLSLGLGSSVYALYVAIAPTIDYFSNTNMSLINTSVKNPAPFCSECLVSKGLHPKCVNVCVQEVIYKGLSPQLACREN